MTMIFGLPVWTLRRMGATAVAFAVFGQPLIVGAHSREYVPGEVIVKLKGKMSSSSSRDFTSKAQGDHGLQLKGSWSSLNLHHYSAKPGTNVQQLIQELQNDPNVEYAEPNYILKKAEILEAGGAQQIMSLEQAQGTVSAMASSMSLGLTSAPIQAVQAWGQVSGDGVPVVAVIDTGIDMTHPALSNAIWINSREINNNNIDDDSNGYVDDINGWNFVNNNNYPQDCDGHGTHVSGIIRGTGQNLFQSPAPAPLIRLMALKFLDCTGSGSTSDAIKAIYYAANNGARVLNNSWGGGGYSLALQQAIAYSYSKTALFVAAAGNSGTNNDSDPMYPAAYDVPNVLSVAATTDSDILANFSNYGAGTVNAAAPGVSILSTYVGGGYTYLSGTSMATPFMSGVAAQILVTRPTMTGYQLKNVILSTVDKISNLTGKMTTGGRLDSLNAVVAGKTVALDTSQPAYSVAISSQDRQIASAIASSGGGCGIVTKLTGAGGGSAGGEGLLGLDGMAARALGILLVLAVPLAVWFQVRRRVSQSLPEHQRRFDRYAIDSTVRLKVGGQELVGSVGTISVGGAAINANVLLDQGSVVTMTIESPDGAEKVQVQGQIMWSNAEQKYGVQFVDANESATSTIAQWTRALVKI